MGSRFVHIVDDDQPVRDSLRWLLSSADIDSQAYDTPEAFLEATRAQPDGCVLLDICMPGIDGVTVLKRLASGGMTAPVIIMTGHGNQSDADEVLRLGAADFIEKPFAADRLLAVIERVMVPPAQADAR
ncbi:response regulator transcription factor [Sphingoaurantiacus capsulatus]|uniref:Response regulator transcription factor n=1 Tax=Sphingoaurantiacus capsulatus TaxID=1771310 RepID=A0ABV7XHN7_9SPHN